MKKIIYLSCIAIALYSITGCVRDANNVTLPQSDPKLVVTAFISPEDTILKVEITKSKPVLGKQDAYGAINAVQNAQVTISDGVQTLQLTYDATALNYSYPLSGNANFIKPGGTYFLTATTPDGKSVSATTTIPANKINATTAVITLKADNTEDYPRDKIEFSFYDISNEENYYRVQAYLLYKENFSEDRISEIYFDNDESRSYQNFNLYSDKNRDGKEFTAIKGHYYSSSSFTASREVVVNVYNASKEYYDYHKSIQNFQGDNPFAEPVLIYSNIKNGLGVFAGYNTTVVTKAIPNP